MIKYAAIVIGTAGLLGGLYAAGIIPGSSPAEGAVDEHGNPKAAAPAVVAAAPIYLALDPPFVVNFQHRGTLHYLQMEMQLMYHDQKIIDRVVSHMPAVRNDLILLLSNQEFEQLITAEGKDQLRRKIVQAVNDIAEVEPDALTGKSDGDVYLTHFVMQ